jgi:hypothetical protein
MPKGQKSGAMPSTEVTARNASMQCMTGREALTTELFPFTPIQS